MHTGQLLGSGRTADVYALDGSWVLRRYRDRTDTTEELAVMSYVGAFGFPVPRIGPPAEGARPTDLVLQRLTGPTLAEALLAGRLGAAEGARCSPACCVSSTRYRPGSRRTRRTACSIWICIRRTWC